MCSSVVGDTSDIKIQGMSGMFFVLCPRSRPCKSKVKVKVKPIGHVHVHVDTRAWSHQRAYILYARSLVAYLTVHHCCIMATDVVEIYIAYRLV